MKKFKFLFIKRFKLLPGIGLLAFCLGLVLVSWLVLPVAALGSTSNYAAVPSLLHETPTPFLPTNQNPGVNSPSDSWHTIFQSGHFQSLLTTSWTPRALVNQSLRSTEIPFPLNQLMTSATQNSPIKATAASVTGVKTVVPLSAAIGEHLRFQISLTNTANDQALNLEVIDDIPDFLTIVQVNTTQDLGDVDITNNRVKVLFQSLDPNRTVEIDIDTIVNNNAIGSFSYDNYAILTYYYINTQFSGQTNTVRYQVTTGPPTPTPSGHPLASQKTVSGSPALRGDLLGFRIEIRNVGTAPAGNLIITDVFPNFLTITNVSTTLGTVQINQNQVVVSINTLAVNQLVRIDISTFVNQDVSGLFTNIANFTYTYLGLPGSGATPAAFYQTGSQVPKLVGVKTVSGSPAAAGDPLGFYIEIVNVGTAPAFNIEITDVFPSFLTITGVTSSKGTVHFNQNTVVININTLLVDEVVGINISTVVNQGVTGTVTSSNVAFFTYYTFQGQSFVGNTNTAIFQISFDDITRIYLALIFR